MSDSALLVRYRKFRYQAQSDIADHGYHTKCPPMVVTTLEDFSNAVSTLGQVKRTYARGCQHISAHLPKGCH
jgi:hypothetical protein